VYYLLIFVFIWPTSLDEHLLFWQPVTGVSLLIIFMLLLHSWLKNKLIEIDLSREWILQGATLDYRLFCI